MSTDVYFDFHSPGGWDLYQAATRADNTNGRAMPLYEKWWAFLKAARTTGQHEEHYDPCRVAYLSNLVADCNYDSRRWPWPRCTRSSTASTPAR